MTKLNAAGSALAYSTFLGGTDTDLGSGIALDEKDRAYVIGSTWSVDYPTTSDAFDRTYNGNLDAVVAKLNTAGSALAYSTFLGGTGQDSGSGIALDEKGQSIRHGTYRLRRLPHHPRRLRPGPRRLHRRVRDQAQARQP